MRDDQDSVIARLFAEREQDLPADDFVLKVGKRIDEQRRLRRVYRVIAIAACVVLAMVSAPLVAQVASTLVELAAMSIGTIGPMFYAPLTWLVVSGTVVGFSPVVYLWRTGRW